MNASYSLLQLIKCCVCSLIFDHDVPMMHIATKNKMLENSFDRRFISKTVVIRQFINTYECSLYLLLDYFLEWASSKKLNEQTVKRLTKDDFNDFDALRVATEDQINSLKITVGQKALLSSAVEELKTFESTGMCYYAFVNSSIVYNMLCKKYII